MPSATSIGRARFSRACSAEDVARGGPGGRAHDLRADEAGPDGPGHGRDGHPERPGHPRQARHHRRREPQPG